ncbi:MAG: hypothetical protein SGJ00_08860 [bacterium]|nr:hypothetical protein [bacterium]
MEITQAILIIASTVVLIYIIKAVQGCMLLKISENAKSAIEKSRNQFQMQMIEKKYEQENLQQKVNQIHEKEMTILRLQ